MNKKTGNSILKNASYLLFSNVIVRFITALASILVARYLGVEDFGILSVGLAFSAVGGYFTDLGLTHTLIREGTKPQANMAELMSSFLKTRLVLAIGTALVSIIIIKTMYEDPYFKTILYWMVMPTIFGASLQGIGAVYFQVIQEMKYTALIRTISGLVTAGTLLVGLSLKWSLLLLAPVYGFSSVIGGILSLWMVGKRVSLVRGWDPMILKGLGYFTFSGLVIMLMPQLGPLVLERVADLKQVGYFAASSRIPSILYQVPGVLAAAFYPRLFQYGNQGDLENHFKLTSLELKLMSFIGVLMALPFLFFSSWWVVTLFGPEWLPASQTLTLLAWMVILQSINYPLADALTTIGLQSRRTIILSFAFFAGFLLYFWFGTKLGSIGGGVAALSIEVFLMLGFIFTNPSGWKIIKHGYKYNGLALMIVLLLGSILVKLITPILGMLIILLVYIGLVLSLDKELRKTAINWISRKRASEGGQN